MADLRTAFKTIDPSIDSEALDENLCCAFLAQTESLNQAVPVDIEVALQRLLAAGVSKAGPPPSHLN